MTRVLLTMPAPGVDEKMGQLICCSALFGVDFFSLVRRRLFINRRRPPESKHVG